MLGKITVRTPLHFLGSDYSRYTKECQVPFHTASDSQDGKIK